MRIDGTQKVWFIMPRSAVEKEKAAEFSSAALED
jgi:hypothetical protein